MEGKASRGEEGICVPSAGRRDLITACRVSLGIVGKCLLSQEMVYKRIGPSTLAGQRFTPLFRTELNFCLDLSTSARPTENRLRGMRRWSRIFQRSVRFIKQKSILSISSGRITRAIDKIVSRNDFSILLKFQHHRRS